MSFSLVGPSTGLEPRSEGGERGSHDPLPCRRSLVSALGVALQRCSYPPHEHRDSNMAEGGPIFVIKKGSNSM